MMTLRCSTERFDLLRNGEDDAHVGMTKGVVRLAPRREPRLSVAIVVLLDILSRLHPNIVCFPLRNYRTKVP